jgi:hypothetical protein
VATTERGQYCSIRITILDGKDFRALPSEGRFIFLVLKMNVAYSGIAVKYRGELTHRVAAQTGYTFESVSDTIDKLIEAGWVCWQDDIIWIVGHLEHNPHLQPGDPKHRKGLLRYLAGLPRVPVVAEYIAAHPIWCRKKEAQAMGLGWAFDGPTEALPRAVEASSSSKNKNKSKTNRLEDGASNGTPFAAFEAVTQAFPRLSQEGFTETDAQMLWKVAVKFGATSDSGKQFVIVAEVAGALDGMHGSRRTVAELRTSIADYLTNPGEAANMSRFRGYLYRTPSTNGQKPTTGQRAFGAAEQAMRNL